MNSPERDALLRERFEHMGAQQVRDLLAADKITAPSRQIAFLWLGEKDREAESFKAASHAEMAETASRAASAAERAAVAAEAQARTAKHALTTAIVATIVAAIALIISMALAFHILR